MWKKKIKNLINIFRIYYQIGHKICAKTFLCLKPHFFVFTHPQYRKK